MEAFYKKFKNQLEREKQLIQKEIEAKLKKENRLKQIETENKQK